MCIILDYLHHHAKKMLVKTGTCVNCNERQHLGVHSLESTFNCEIYTKTFKNGSNYYLKQYWSEFVVNELKLHRDQCSHYQFVCRETISTIMNFPAFQTCFEMKILQKLRFDVMNSHFSWTHSNNSCTFTWRRLAVRTTITASTWQWLCDIWMKTKEKNHLISFVWIRSTCEHTWKFSNHPNQNNGCERLKSTYGAARKWFAGDGNRCFGCGGRPIEGFAYQRSVLILFNNLKMYLWFRRERLCNRFDITERMTLILNRLYALHQIRIVTN